MNKDTKGALEVVGVVVAVGAIASIGWYWYKNKGTNGANGNIDMGDTVLTATSWGGDTFGSKGKKAMALKFCGFEDADKYFAVGDYIRIDKTGTQKYPIVGIGDSKGGYKQSMIRIDVGDTGDWSEVKRLKALVNAGKTADKECTVVISKV